MTIVPFTGVGPRLYEDLFAKRGELKDGSGRFLPPEGGVPAFAVRLEGLATVEMAAAGTRSGGETMADEDPIPFPHSGRTIVREPHHEIDLFGSLAGSRGKVVFLDIEEWTEDEFLGVLTRQRGRHFGRPQAKADLQSPPLSAQGRRIPHAGSLDPIRGGCAPGRRGGVGDLSRRCGIECPGIGAPRQRTNHPNPR